MILYWYWYVNSFSLKEALNSIMLRNNAEVMFKIVENDPGDMWRHGEELTVFPTGTRIR